MDAKNVSRSKAKSESMPQIDVALVGKQQLLVKSRLQANALVARQQLFVKRTLAGRSNNNNQ